MSCLRPSPPLRPCLALGRDDSPRKSTRSYNRRQSDRTFEEDAQILRVIEAYCSSAKSRYTVNSVDLGHLSRSSVPSQTSSATAVQHGPHNKARASTWCCGNFVIRTLRKTHFD